KEAANERDAAIVRSSSRSVARSAHLVGARYRSAVLCSVEIIRGDRFPSDRTARREPTAAYGRCAWTIAGRERATTRRNRSIHLGSASLRIPRQETSTPSSRSAGTR